MFNWLKKCVLTDIFCFRRRPPVPKRADDLLVSLWLFLVPPVKNAEYLSGVQMRFGIRNFPHYKFHQGEKKL